MSERAAAPPLPLEEAQARLLALAEPLPPEQVDIASALGRYLAEPVHARRTQPAADLSAMDGYAVRQNDLAGPWTIIGESAAGHPFPGTVVQGAAVRIATGAVVPSGADSILLQEDCAREGTSLCLSGTAPAPMDKHIRRRGLDFHEGDLLLKDGERIGPAQIALALSGGNDRVTVRRRPLIAIIDSGDELGLPGACASHQIPASNGPMLQAMAASLPCSTRRIGPVPDSLDALADALGRCEDADVIVTSGGASVGDHDLVRSALEAWGAELDFWRVAIRPGKPLLVARKGHQLVVGLPGNPVSSHVTAYFFLLPLIRSLLGASACLPRGISAVLAQPFAAGGKRREFVRGFWDGARVIPNSVQDSSALSALAASNVLIDRVAASAAREAGEAATIYLLENGGMA